MSRPVTLTLLNGNTVRILTAGQDSGGQLTVIDYLDYTQGNPPPFTRHAFVEVFTVLEGQLAFQYQDETMFHVETGSAVTVAPGRAHTFWNPQTSPLRILLACSPAGLDDFFKDIHSEFERLGEGALRESDIPAAMERIRLTHGIEQTAPAPQIDYGAEP